MRLTLMVASFAMLSTSLLAHADSIFAFDNLPLSSPPITLTSNGASASFPISDRDFEIGYSPAGIGPAISDSGYSLVIDNLLLSFLHLCRGFWHWHYSGPL